MPELLATQRAFAGAIRSREREADLLARLTGDTPRNTELIALYRGNAVANALGALRLAYPVCEKMLGAECFADLARLYWREFPTNNGDLNCYGAALADLFGQREEFATQPWLADVARLEWAVHTASMAADHTPLTLQAIAMLTPEALAASRFQMQAGMHIIASDWPIASIWAQHQPSYTAELDLAGRGKEIALIHREWLAVSISSLTTPQAACLLALQAGMPVSRALSGSSEGDENFDAAACLALAFKLQLISGILPGAQQ